MTVACYLARADWRQYIALPGNKEREADTYNFGKHFVHMHNNNYDCHNHVVRAVERHKKVSRLSQPDGSCALGLT